VSRARLAASIAAVVAVACGPHEAQRPAADRAPAAPAVRIDAPRMAALSCDVDSAGTRSNCRVAIPITIVNASTAPVYVERLRRDDTTGELSLVSPAPVLVPPGVLALTIWSHREHALAVVIRVRAAVERDGAVAPGDIVDQVAAPAILVTNPARDAARTACRACDGHFMPVPQAPSDVALPGTDLGETCNCHTHDAGKACRDSDDCEGWCIGTGFTVTVKYGDKAYGYRSGVCSDQRIRETCAAPIENGARKRPLEPAPDGIIDFGSMCIDYVLTPQLDARMPGDDGLD
jgi:hypothetical protein